MTQANESLFKKENVFFVLDSDHLNAVQSCLYGYTYADDRVVSSLEELDGQEPSADGTYVYVRREGQQIRITQDFNGCFGLYLFRQGNSFVLSNSFMMLVEYLPSSCKLTLNREYADYLLFVNTCSSIMKETLVREITCLDRSAVITIDIPGRTLDIQLTDFPENTVDPGSPEGLALLDSWRNRWAACFRFCVNSSGSIRADLSGGFDSRMTMSLLLSSGIDLNQIYVYSNQDSLHTHSEDYRIASRIAEHYGLELNRIDRQAPEEAFPLRDILEISFYDMLGFHKQLYFKRGMFVRRNYEIGGRGGGCLRNYLRNGEEKNIRSVLKRAEAFSSIPQDQFDTMTSHVKSLLHRSFETLRDKYRSLGKPVDEDALSQYLYRETRCRYHFGKSQVAVYSVNSFPLSPLMDADMRRLSLTSQYSSDPNFLPALIYDRYAPDLLLFEFEGGRSIDPETIRIARQQNRQHPFVSGPAPLTRPSVRKEETPRASVRSDAYIEKEEVDAVLFSAFRSEAFQQLFGKCYSPAVYNSILRIVSESSYHPLQPVYAAFGIAMILWKNSPLSQEDPSYIRFLLDHADQNTQWPPDLSRIPQDAEIADFPRPEQALKGIRKLLSRLRK